jgi:hypothetical protein
MTMSELHIPEDRIDSQVWPQLDILVSCINRHAHEFNTFAVVERIAEEIAIEFDRRRVGPALSGECDIRKAAECFAAICLRKQLAPDDNMVDCFMDTNLVLRCEKVTYSKDYYKYDQYITFESKEALRVLTSFSASELEDGIAFPRHTRADIGVHTKLG